MKILNGIVAAAVVAAGMAGMTACKNAGALAKKVDGDWSGVAVRFEKKTMVDGDFTPLLRFEQNGTKAGGSVTLSAQVSVTMPVNAPIDSAGTTAVSATAAGIATVRGTWNATDDDELKIRFDHTTLTIDVDPEVRFELANIWTTTDVPTIRPMSKQVVDAFTREMTTGMMSALDEMDEIDDIKIDENLMYCEFMDRDYTFNRIYE